MKKLVLFGLLATVSQPIMASVTYAVYPALPIIGDGTTAQGGIAPAYASEPADIPSNFDITPWLISGLTLPPPSTGSEAKFRTHCHYSHVSRDDPIVYPGQPGLSHVHMFFGNTLTDANSTYTSLRTTGGSTCAGGPINRSAYWIPALIEENPLGDGIDRIVKPDYTIPYYIVADSEKALKTRIPRGFAMIGGFNPADPGDTAIKAEVAAAGGMSYKGNGFIGWKCETVNGSNANSPVPGSAQQPYLKNANGTATLTCPATDRIAATLDFPTCWNGTQITSANGRAHLRYRQHSNNSGKDICPQGYWQIFGFELITWWPRGHDLTKLYLSCDRMPGMQQFLNGQCFHGDWLGAWDYGTVASPGIHLTFTQLCNGTTVPGSPLTPRGASCTDSGFGDDRKGIVKVVPPDNSDNPGNYSNFQVDLGTDWTSRPIAERYLDIPAASSSTSVLGTKGGKTHKTIKGHKHMTMLMTTEMKGQ
jgi:hypothetical protein